MTHFRCTSHHHSICTLQASKVIQRHKQHTQSLRLCESQHWWCKRINHGVRTLSAPMRQQTWIHMIPENFLWPMQKLKTKNVPQHDKRPLLKASQQWHKDMFTSSSFQPNSQKAAVICDLHECLSQESGHGVQDDRALTVRAPRGLFCQSTAGQATAAGVISRNKWGVRLWSCEVASNVSHKLVTSTFICTDGKRKRKYSETRHSWEFLANPSSVMRVKQTSKQ